MLIKADKILYTSPTNVTMLIFNDAIHLEISNNQDYLWRDTSYKENCKRTMITYYGQWLLNRVAWERIIANAYHQSTMCMSAYSNRLM